MDTQWVLRRVFLGWEGEMGGDVPLEGEDPRGL